MAIKRAVRGDICPSLVAFWTHGRRASRGPYPPQSWQAKLKSIQGLTIKFQSVHACRHNRLDGRAQAGPRGPIWDAGALVGLIQGMRRA
jgi:hypothetical protein